jgi:hypothetical protein
MDSYSARSLEGTAEVWMTDWRNSAALTGTGAAAPALVRVRPGRGGSTAGGRTVLLGGGLRLRRP